MSPAGIQSLSRFEVSKVRYRGKYRASSSEATESSPTVTVHVSPFNAANSPLDCHCARPPASTTSGFSGSGAPKARTIGLQSETITSRARGLLFNNIGITLPIQS
ncbi:hypothetical protein AUP68_03394 [Ilyonectria robusta]